MMKKIFTLIFLFFAFLNWVAAQQYRPLPANKIYHKLRQFNTLGTVMYIAAHPDDENTRLISYLVHHDHVRTVYLSLTRGDGGQNILGNEQGHALGFIRTLEMQEARKLDGAEQLYTSVIDFGFTKNQEETFAFWDKEKIIEEIIDAIQLYRPDVLITRFPTTGEGGHGQHTASAIAAQEAYKILVERKSRKDKNLWLPERLLFNAFRFGDRNTTNENQFKLPINQYDPLLGESYSENAGRSRSMHKSQGAGTPQTVGIYNEYFELLEGAEMKKSLYDNIDTSWSRIGRKDIQKEVEEIIAGYDFAWPEKSIPALINVRKMLKEKVEDKFWQSKKLKEIDQIILSCAGVMAEVLTDKQEAVRGEEINLTINLIARCEHQVKLNHVSFNPNNESELKNLELKSDSLYSFSHKIKISANEPYSQPYWLINKTDGYRFDYSQQYGYPLSNASLFATVSLNINGEHFRVEVPYSYKRLDPVRGDVIETLRVVPDVSVAPVESLLIYEENKTKNALVRLQVMNDLSDVILIVSAKEKILAGKKINQLKAGQDTVISINIEAKYLTKNISDEEINYLLISGKDTFNQTKNLIAYEHIPEMNYYTPASTKAILKNWNSTAKKIGYIEGAGDYVASVLQLCGLEVTYLTPKDFASIDDLMKYDAIITGVRSYNTNNDIASWHSLLMQYVRNGGNLVMQYNTDRNIKVKEIGVYPFKLSRNRVTEEDAKIAFINPDHVLLNKPNKITPNDFDNWVQERGIYFPVDWDSRYQLLLGMNDKNEKQLKSAILYTPYGKGHYIYTSLVFFRQLPAGNTGAIRLMMNMLSVGR